MLKALLAFAAIFALVAIPIWLLAIALLSFTLRTSDRIVDDFEAKERRRIRDNFPWLTGEHDEFHDEFDEFDPDEKKRRKARDAVESSLRRAYEGRK